MSSPASEPFSWDMLHAAVLDLPSESSTGKLEQGDPGGFASPSARDDERKLSVEQLVSLVFVSSGAGVDVCGGKVGIGNAKFCSLACAPNSTSCGLYATHGKKAPIVASTHYISAHKSGTAYLNPSLTVPSHGLPEAIADELSGNRSIQEWTQLFASLKDVSTLSTVEVNNLLQRMNRKVSWGMTPIRLGKPMTELTEGKGATMEDVLNKSLIAEGTEDAEIVQHIQGHWNDVVRSTQRQRRLMIENSSDVKSILEEMDDKILSISAMVGSQPTTNAPGATVWSSIAAQSIALQTVSRDSSTNHEKVIREVDRLEVVVNEVHQKLEQKVLPTVTTLYQRIGERPMVGLDTSPISEVTFQKVESEVKQVSERFEVDMNTLREELQQSMVSERRFQEMAQEVRILRGRTSVISELEKEIHALKQQVRNSGRPTTVTEDMLVEALHKLKVDDDINMLKDELGKAKDHIAELRLSNDKLKAEMNSETISFGGYYFQSPASFEQFVIKHFPSGYYGFCFDFISMLECYQDRNRTSDEGIKNKYHYSMAGYDNPNQARIDQSFGCVVPHVFGKPEATGNAAKKLSALPMLKDWDDPSNESGLKVSIDEFMTEYLSTVEGQIEGMFGSSHAISIFFINLVTHVKTFWDSLSAWVTRFERELTHQGGRENMEAHKETVWNLVCWMLFSMFREMAKRRIPGCKVITSLTGETVLENNVQKTAAILRGALGAHKFMQELVKADFIRHPIFSATMDQYLLRHKVSDVTLASFNVRVKKLEDGYKGIQATADKALDKVDKVWKDVSPSIKDKQEKPTNKVIWTFGEGEHGWKKPIDVSLNTIIVDEVFPWWWAASKAQGFNVSSIWLTSQMSAKLETLVRSWCTGVKVILGTPPDQHISEIKSTQVILFGGKIPEVLFTTKALFTSQQRLICAPGGCKISPPPGWRKHRLVLRHNEVGGITDGSFSMTIFTPNTVEWNDRLCTSGMKHDLRWILKCGIDGKYAPIPSDANQSEVATKVKYVGKGIVSAVGLYPFKDWNTQVCTEFRGKHWVIRMMSRLEILLSWDISEKLIRTANEIGISEELCPKIPGKIFQALSVHFHKILRGKGSVKRRRENVGTTPSKKHRTEQSTISRQELVAISLVGNDQMNPNIKATKNDNAEVRKEMWNQIIIDHFDLKVSDDVVATHLDSLRKIFLRMWKKICFRSFVKWKARYPEDAEHSKDAIADCFQRVASATWWNWDEGSRPLFWNWPSEYQSIIRDGLPPFFSRDAPKWRKKQRPPTNGHLHEKIKEKLDVIRRKRYVEPGPITSLMPYFDVPKGDDDVRMVYDGSASGLNECIWAPWFPLPTVDCLIRSVTPGYWMADNDVGEMFHNFVLHPTMQRYCGLDVTMYYPDELQNKATKRIWERWTRLAMGLRNSPYTAVQGMLIAQESIWGDRHDVKNNVFHWESVSLNLPGSTDYDPAQPWVSKRRRDGTIAADVFIYVDDVRCTAPSEKEAWAASQRVSSILGHLGLQDAARKRREPGMEGGAWTGSVVWTTNDQVSVLTTQEKWDKVKHHLQWISENMENPNGLNGRMMKSIRGFLVYISRTYPIMVPYLKGIHATIDSWQLGRDSDGWKVKKRKQQPPIIVIEEMSDEDYLLQSYSVDVSQSEPENVTPVRRLKWDIHSLMELTKSDVPPRRRARMQNQAKVMYGFGDASKQGFGATIELPNKNLYWRLGRWGLKEEVNTDTGEVKLLHNDEVSSNYRELRNLVEAIEFAFHEGLLVDTELFMFTDNSTAEAAFFKGTSSSKLLFELVLRLRKIEMSGQCIIHMIHVAGTRMIWQGTDGLSRGDYNAGVMTGESMLDFIPLHVNLIQRTPKICEWIETSLAPLKEQNLFVQWLEPTDWPLPLKERKIFIWVPPPAAADVALEYMTRSHHKRPHAIHIFMCPRLMTARWLKLMLKATDINFRMPIGSSLWDNSQHEPFIVAISFPLLRTHPWRFNRTGECDHYRSILHTVSVEDFTRTGATMCQCISQAVTMAPVFG